MAGIAQIGQKHFIFFVVPPLRIENIKERREKIRSLYSKYKKYM